MKSLRLLRKVHLNPVRVHVGMEEGRKDEKRERYLKLINFGKNITNENTFFKADVKKRKHLK